MAAGSRTIGGTLRYETILKLASGGMATVYVGTVRGALGFRQLVAIKKPHPNLVGNAESRRELLAEAQLASMIHHANVVDVRDVEVDNDSISLVMDYIEGASLGELLVAASKGIAPLSPAVAVRIILDACAGLHAAHELHDDKGRFIGLVHRDVSPQNILVGTDGVARVTDFGIAKIARRQANTEEGHLKGKLAYMAPEYLRGESIDRRFDVFGMGVVLWEALTGKRLFRGDHEAETLQRVLAYDAPAVSSLVPQSTPSLDHVVAAAVAKNRDDRFQTAAALGAALETAARDAGLLASHTDVAALVRAAVGPDLEERRTLVRARMSMEPAIASVGPVTPNPGIDGASPIDSIAAPTTEPAPTAPAPTMPLAGSLTQPLTSPMPTVKEQGGATLLSSSGQSPAPAVHPAARTLSSAPMVVLPPMAPSGAGTPSGSGTGSSAWNDTSDDSHAPSARLPVRSNAPLLIVLIGVSLIALGVAASFALRARTAVTAATADAPSSAASSAPATSAAASSSEGTGPGVQGAGHAAAPGAGITNGAPSAIASAPPSNAAASTAAGTRRPGGARTASPPAPSHGTTSAVPAAAPTPAPSPAPTPVPTPGAPPPNPYAH
jgi:serine/threonine-protein kinase